jgi:hypothetical protein
MVVPVCNVEVDRIRKGTIDGRPDSRRCEELGLLGRHGVGKAAARLLKPRGVARNRLDLSDCEWISGNLEEAVGLSPCDGLGSDSIGSRLGDLGWVAGVESSLKSHSDETPICSNNGPGVNRGSAHRGIGGVVGAAVNWFGGAALWAVHLDRGALIGILPFVLDVVVDCEVVVVGIGAGGVIPELLIEPVRRRRADAVLDHPTNVVFAKLHVRVIPLEVIVVRVSVGGRRHEVELVNRRIIRGASRGADKGINRRGASGMLGNEKGGGYTPESARNGVDDVSNVVG